MGWLRLQTLAVALLCYATTYTHSVPMRARVVLCTQKQNSPILQLILFGKTKQCMALAAATTAPSQAMQCACYLELPEKLFVDCETGSGSDGGTWMSQRAACHQTPPPPPGGGDFLACAAGMTATYGGDGDPIGCVNCPAGTFSSGYSKAHLGTCIPCAEGKFAAAGSPKCMSCDFAEGSGTGAPQCGRLDCAGNSGSPATVSVQMIMSQTTPGVTTSFDTSQDNTIGVGKTELVPKLLCVVRFPGSFYTPDKHAVTTQTIAGWVRLYSAYGKNSGRVQLYSAKFVVQDMGVLSLQGLILGTGISKDRGPLGYYHTPDSQKVHGAVLTVEDGGTLFVSNCQVSEVLGGSAQKDQGGAPLWMKPSSTAIISNSLFAHNVGFYAGAAVVQRGANLRFQNVDFDHNAGFCQGVSAACEPFAGTIAGFGRGSKTVLVGGSVQHSTGGRAALQAFTGSISVQGTLIATPDQAACMIHNPQPCTGAASITAGCGGEIIVNGRKIASSVLDASARTNAALHSSFATDPCSNAQPTCVADMCGEAPANNGPGVKNICAEQNCTGERGVKISKAKQAIIKDIPGDQAAAHAGATAGAAAALKFLHSLPKIITDHLPANIQPSNEPGYATPASSLSNAYAAAVAAMEGQPTAAQAQTPAQPPGAGRAPRHAQVGQVPAKKVEAEVKAGALAGQEQMMKNARAQAKAQQTPTKDA